MHHVIFCFYVRAPTENESNPRAGAQALRAAQLPKSSRKNQSEASSTVSFSSRQSWMNDSRSESQSSWLRAIRLRITSLSANQDDAGSKSRQSTSSPHERSQRQLSELDLRKTVNVNGHLVSHSFRTGHECDLDSSRAGSGSSPLGLSGISGARGGSSMNVGYCWGIWGIPDRIILLAM